MKAVDIQTTLRCQMNDLSHFESVIPQQLVSLHCTVASVEGAWQEFCWMIVVPHWGSSRPAQTAAWLLLGLEGGLTAQVAAGSACFNEAVIVLPHWLARLVGSRLAVTPTGEGFDAQRQHPQHHHHGGLTPGGLRTGYIQ
jgi:hypothetical protein